jgi:uncharacterized protein
MPFEMTASAPQRIAVIGGGISGMAAAHLLATDHAVVLFEGEKRLGGHARTVIAGKRGDQPVDTGFIVFNKVNYPNLVGLFDRLEVPVTESDMGFGASFGDGALEYALRSVGAVFAQKRNLLNPAYLRMLRDILHFNKNALATAKGHDMTIGALLQALGTGPMFRDYYIAPLSGAIWSTPVRDILDFPAQAMIDFSRTTRSCPYLVSINGTPSRAGQWNMCAACRLHLTAKWVDIRLGAPVAGRRGWTRRDAARPRGRPGRHLTRWFWPPIPMTPLPCCRIRRTSSVRDLARCAISRTRPCCTRTPA